MFRANMEIFTSVLFGTTYKEKHAPHETTFFPFLSRMDHNVDYFQTRRNSVTAKAFPCGKTV